MILDLIKDMVVILHQMPEKSHIMDVVVANVPPKFKMLLSRSWETKLKGTFQMDLSYAMIPVFSEKWRLYRENHSAYMINNKENPENYMIYAIDTGMGSSMLFNDLCPQENVSGPSESARGEATQIEIVCKSYSPERLGYQFTTSG
jgi:hypothetical protein